MHAPPERFERTKLLDRHLGRSDELALAVGEKPLIHLRPCWVLMMYIALLGFLQLISLTGNSDLRLLQRSLTPR